MSTRWLLIRSAAVLGAGLIFMGYEVFFEPHPDPGKLAVIAAMITGASLADLADHMRAKRNGGSSRDESS